jgi:hypothetical protein
VGSDIQPKVLQFNQAESKEESKKIEEKQLQYTTEAYSVKGGLRKTARL